MTEIVVREEWPAAAGDVHRVVTAAFGQPAEADLVNRLRGRPGVFALVAMAQGEMVGHIMFSPVTVRASSMDAPVPSHPGAVGALCALGLAPMAVAPSWQRRGIGSRLVCAGLDACRARGAELVVVLGHPEYYPRFGFAPAAALGLTCTWPVPPEAFMAVELRPGAPAAPRSRGARLVEYLPEFDDV